MIPSCDHTGTLHFHSSMTCGSASLMSSRMRASVSPRQSASSAIRCEMSADADWPCVAPGRFIRSATKYRAQILGGQDVVHPAKGSLLAHGERRVAHRGERESCERTADAHSPHARRLEFLQREARVGKSH